MSRYFLIFGLLFSYLTTAQEYEYVYKNPEDSTYNCYLTITPPDSIEVKGLLVRDYSSLPSLPSNKPYPYKWRDLALENGLIVLYTVTSSYFPELYYQDEAPQRLDEIIHEVVEKHKISKEYIFIGGISASGARAMRFAQFCEMGKSKYGTKITGVFSVDSPLDLERFYNSVHNHKENFTDGMLWEAKLMTKVFKEQFSDSPLNIPEEYRASSVYSYTNPKASNAKWLMNTSVIFFHEPDIDWWIEERGATYFDINSFDIAGLYNYLKLSDHKDVELVTTTQKGFNRKGERNCHSWTIVDEVYLIDWILKRID